MFSHPRKFDTVTNPSIITISYKYKWLWGYYVDVLSPKEKKNLIN